MKSYWVRLFLRYARQSHLNRPAGVTLLELLAAIIMSALVVSGLLAAVVNLGQSTRDERILAQTQSEIEAAATFISDELREAVNIYTADELATIQVGGTDLPGIESILGIADNLNDNLEPILVFWKSETIPYDGTGPDVPTADFCADGSLTTAQRNECIELRAERRSYTLVAYILDNRDSETFEGPARIRRYQLRKYSDPSSLTREPGYVDPLKESRSFIAWPYDINGMSLQAMPIPSADVTGAPVLVDYIDDFTNPNINNANLPICMDADVAGGSPDFQAFQDFGGDYIRTPDVAQSAPVQITSFFACVRDVNPFTEDGSQDTVFYIRGNPDGREGFRFNPQGPTPLPSVQVQTASFGTVDKIIN